ncbi:hypothetical protein BDY24DRAFT_379324 [Mrakia frigida]|uniref:O-fucosyltransferase family protein n=1 Tax=Mrakia frigida TaxID=29902 RepID=UPI003FCC103A
MARQSRRLLLVLFLAGFIFILHSGAASSSWKWRSSSTGRALVQGGGAALLKGKLGDPSLDRLDPDVFYLTAGPGRDSGFTNQVMSVFNLIYLAMLTQRTPILPPFYSNWQLSEIEDFPALAVSSVFDLPRFQAETAQIQQSGILEWEDINGVIDPSRATDPSWPEVGCWGGGPLTEEWSMSFAKINPIYHPYPGETNPVSPKLSLSWAAFMPYLLPNSLFFQDLVDTLPPTTLRPNEKFACAEWLYHGTKDGTHSQGEYKKGLGGWGHVGKKMRFREEIVEEAQTLLKKIFGVSKKEEVPPFVVFHVRHGDFDWQCKDDNPCFTTAQFAFALAKMQREYERQGDALTRPPFPTEVLVISDETEPAFYSELRERGWRSTFDVNGLENSKLVKELGGWYLLLVETVLLSQGTHFLGTAESTMSLLAGLRTQDWNGGMYRMVSASDPS